MGFNTPWAAGTSAGGRKRASIGRAAIQTLATLASATAILSPVAFVALRTIYAQFYEPFGLTPEDVGLDSARVFGQREQLQAIAEQHVILRHADSLHFVTWR